MPLVQNIHNIHYSIYNNTSICILHYTCVAHFQHITRYNTVLKTCTLHSWVILCHFPIFSEQSCYCSQSEKGGNSNVQNGIEWGKKGRKFQMCRYISKLQRDKIKIFLQTNFSPIESLWSELSIFNKMFIHSLNLSFKLPFMFYYYRQWQKLLWFDKLINITGY